MEYASKGVAGAALGTGIGGLALGVLNGGLGNLLSGWNNGGCSENMPINRYEAQQSARIAELETEVKLRDANTYTDGKLSDFRDYVERRFDRVEHELCDQRVYNATLNGTVSCISSQIAALQSLTKLVIPNSSICPGWDTTTTTTTP